MKTAHALGIMTLLLFASIAVAQTAPKAASEPARAENWCAEAQKNLLAPGGVAVTCVQVEKKRCVLMNNYWCQKHTPGSPWRGTPKPGGGDGLADLDGHAIFENGDWSARAIAIDLRSKYVKRKLLTAVAIASAHSPWCDTLGSKAIVNGHGRTCNDGRAKPPASFKGPWCVAPTNPAPTTADCKPGCNCPPEIASKLVQNSGKGINDDLGLFDDKGVATSALNGVMGNLAVQEMGYRPNDAVIQRGIDKLQAK